MRYRNYLFILLLYIVILTICLSLLMGDNLDLCGEENLLVFVFPLPFSFILSFFYFITTSLSDSSKIYRTVFLAIFPLLFYFFIFFLFSLFSCFDILLDSFRIKLNSFSRMY